MIKTLKSIGASLLSQPLRILKSQEGKVALERKHQLSSNAEAMIARGYHWPQWHAELNEEELYTLIENQCDPALPNELYY